MMDTPFRIGSNDSRAKVMINVIICPHIYYEILSKMCLLRSIHNATRGPKGHITCTWVQCVTFLMDWPRRPYLYTNWPENTNLVEDVQILLLVKFRWIRFSGFREVENVSANQKPGRPSCFSDPRENTNLVEDVEILLSVKFRLIPFSGFRRELKKVSQPIRGQGGHLVFPIGAKNTNLVEDVEILLPVKFRWILFSGFRRKCEKSTTKDDGQCMITIVHFSLCLRCTKNLNILHSDISQVRDFVSNLTFSQSRGAPTPPEYLGPLNSETSIMSSGMRAWSIPKFFDISADRPKSVRNRCVIQVFVPCMMLISLRSLPGVLGTLNEPDIFIL